MKYLIIDACLGGSGIRDYYEGGYIDPDTLSLSSELKERLSNWLIRYENEHYNGYEDQLNIDQLDNEGKSISHSIKNELQEVKVMYYSDARMVKEQI
ncbi:MAG: hypothetical protein AAF901_13245 [Bacteroidota bacterium]